MKAYLAHGTSEKQRGVVLQHRIEELGLEVCNPFIAVPQGSSAEFMVEHELRAIESCDILVALITPAARAAHMEVFYAARILHRPVFVVYETKRDSSRFKFHPWYDYLTQSFATEDELIQALKVHF